MEVLSIILCFWLFMLVLALFIWMFVIQNSITKLSDTVNELKKLLLKDSLHSTKPARQETQPETQKSLCINDIPDEILSQDKKITTQTDACETRTNTTFQTQSKTLQEYEKQSSSTEFEKIFLGNVFNKIGAFAILIGVIIFIKLISPFIIFTPAVKAGLGFLAGFLMIAAALKTHGNKKLQNYSEVLLGTGFGTLFITTYCASTILDVFDMKLTFVIATGLLCAAFYITDKLKTVSMLVISLIAGYLNPFFIQPASPNFLMSYLIFVNLLSIIYTYRNKSRNTANIVNLCLTLLTSLIFVKEMPFFMPEILWALYFVYSLACSQKQPHLNNNKLNLINYLVFSINLYHITPFSVKTVAYTQLALTFIYAATAYLKKNTPEVFRNYIHLTLAPLTLFVIYIFDESPSARCITLSLETAILSSLAYRFNYKALANWAAGVWTTAFLSILTIDGVFATKSIGNFLLFGIYDF